MNRNELMAYLPHRGNMLLIDGAYLDGGKSHGHYAVRGDEWFLDGHFPGNPVVPGVVLCEILAQSACVLVGRGQEPCATPLFAGISSARFKSPVRPGDVIETVCEITRSKHPFYFASGEARVDGKLCLKAEFSFALVEGS